MTSSTKKPDSLKDLKSLKSQIVKHQESHPEAGENAFTVHHVSNRGRFNKTRLLAVTKESRQKEVKPLRLYLKTQFNRKRIDENLCNTLLGMMNAYLDGRLTAKEFYHYWGSAFTMWTEKQIVQNLDPIVVVETKEDKRFDAEWDRTGMPNPFSNKFKQEKGDKD